MENVVIITEFIYGECPYKGCKLNDDGFCLTENIDFLWGLLQMSVENTTFFCCQEQDVPQGHCEFCGTKLEKTIQLRHLGLIKYEWVCPEC